MQRCRVWFGCRGALWSCHALGGTGSHHPKTSLPKDEIYPHQWRGSGALRQEQEDRLVGLFDGGAHFSLGLPRVGAGTSSRSDLELPKFQVCRKAFFHREGKKNQVLSTWRLHSGHHIMETKAICFGGEFLGRRGFGTECPDAVYLWKRDQRMGWGKTSGVNPPCYYSCKNGVKINIFVHLCHLAQHELCLCIQKASLYDSSNIPLSAVFKIFSPMQRENTGIYVTKRLGRTHVLFSGRKQNAHQNTSKGKPITFYFQKALIFYSCHYVLKSAQVFIGGYPVWSREGGDTCFSSCSVHKSLSPNSHPVHPSAAVISGVTVACSHTSCPLWGSQGFFACKSQWVRPTESHA